MTVWGKLAIALTQIKAISSTRAGSSDGTTMTHSTGSGGVSRISIDPADGADLAKLKEITDKLEADDPEESMGHAFVTDEKIEDSVGKHDNHER